jgi:deazaflavin-dependent oxidoreductase (nitroreductase family)
LFGHRFLMIEHRGRRSGRLYRTVVEVVGRERGRDEWFVVSGYGPDADWYRNLRSSGPEAVWIGSRRHNASVRFLEPEESARVLAAYEQAHPKTAELLMEEMGVGYDGTDAGREEMMTRIPMIALQVRR